MDDVAIKREARRRKILENSEKRLQKITRSKLEENDNEIPTFSSHIGKSTDLQPELKSINQLISSNGRNINDVREKNFTLPKELSMETTSPTTKDLNRIQTSVKFWHKLGFKLAILAVIVRIVHIFKLGYLFGETIVVPFAVFMMTQLGTCQFDQNGAGITGPLLFFIGMSPNKIKTILICYNVVTSILVYFAIYFFSFVCAHLTFITVFGL